MTFPNLYRDFYIRL
uniref:Uncharacterized protein n=1 Tax=Megaselia scalaris TaxID=36166 RepID=T1GQR3_MEGSC